MKYRISVGIMGWIDALGPFPMPATSHDTAFLSPIWLKTAVAESLQAAPTPFNWWLAKTYLGLMATTNKAPKADKFDFKGYRASHDFRAMVWADLIFDGGPPGARGPVRATFAHSEKSSAIVDAGWTPPIDMHKVGAMGILALALERHIWVPGTNDKTLANLISRKSHPGEYSPLSHIRLDRPHPNSTLGPLPVGERFIASALMRFRAGPVTDDVGIKDAQSPYHVPWVWAEFMLSYLGHGRVRLQGASSIFPTLAWYLDGNQVKPPHRQVGDSVPLPWILNHPESLKIWPVLSVGKKGGLEAPLESETQFAGITKPVTKLPNSVIGNRWVDVTYQARPLTRRHAAHPPGIQPGKTPYVLGGSVKREKGAYLLGSPWSRPDHPGR